MKYLPKSKLGVIIAGLYLLLLGYLIFVITTDGSRNPHSEGAMALVGIAILTLPLSSVLISGAVDKIIPADSPVGLGLLMVIFVCAVILKYRDYLFYDWICG